MRYLVRNRCEFSNSFKLWLYSIVVFLQAFLLRRLRLTKGAAEEKRRRASEWIPQKANFSHFHHHLSVFFLHFTACVFCFGFFWLLLLLCFISPTLTEWQKTDASEKVTSAELLFIWLFPLLQEEASQKRGSVREFTKRRSLFFFFFTAPNGRK